MSILNKLLATSLILQFSIYAFGLENKDSCTNFTGKYILTDATGNNKAKYYSFSQSINPTLDIKQNGCQDITIIGRGQKWATALNNKIESAPPNEVTNSIESIYEFVKSLDDTHKFFIDLIDYNKITYLLAKREMPNANFATSFIFFSNESKNEIIIWKRYPKMSFHFDQIRLKKESTDGSISLTITEHETLWHSNDSFSPNSVGKTSSYIIRPFEHLMECTGIGTNEKDTFYNLFKEDDQLKLSVGKPYQSTENLPFQISENKFITFETEEIKNGIKVKVQNKIPLQNMENSGRYTCNGGISYILPENLFNLRAYSINGKIEVDSLKLKCQYFGLKDNFAAIKPDMTCPDQGGFFPAIDMSINRVSPF